MDLAANIIYLLGERPGKEPVPDALGFADISRLCSKIYSVLERRRDGEGYSFAFLTGYDNLKPRISSRTYANSERGIFVEVVSTDVFPKSEEGSSVINKKTHLELRIVCSADELEGMVLFFAEATEMPQNKWRIKESASYVASEVDFTKFRDYKALVEHLRGLSHDDTAVRDLRIAMN